MHVPYRKWVCQINVFGSAFVGAKLYSLKWNTTKLERFHTQFQTKNEKERERETETQRRQQQQRKKMIWN